VSTFPIFMTGLVSNLSNLGEGGMSHNLVLRSRLRPGGWFEVQETHVDIYSEGDNLVAESPLLKWSHAFGTAAELQVSTSRYLLTSLGL
jgi:hypothetical protein